MYSKYIILRQFSVFTYTQEQMNYRKLNITRNRNLCLSSDVYAYNIFSVWVKFWLNIRPLLFSWTADKEIKLWPVYTQINCGMHSCQISGNGRRRSFQFNLCCKLLNISPLPVLSLYARPPSILLSRVWDICVFMF